MVHDQTEQWLDSDENAAFWRGNTMSQAQAYLAGHREDKPELYKALRMMFKLAQFEKKEGAHG